MLDARYEELFADLRRLCRTLGAGTESEDLAQEALIVARSHISALRDDSKLLAWVRRIAVREFFRRRRMPAAIPFDDAWGGGLGLGQIELRADERYAISRLSPRQRQFVALVYVAGYRQDEVAEMIGVSRGTVARTLWDARVALVDALAEYGKGGS